MTFVEIKTFIKSRVISVKTWMRAHKRQLFQWLGRVSIGLAKIVIEKMIERFIGTML